MNQEKIIRKFTTIKLQMSHVDDEVKVRLTYGSISGSFYSVTYPEEQFDTEEEALEYTYKTAPYSTWLILPIIQFNNF